MTERLSASDPAVQRALGKKPSNKYGAKGVRVDGIWFDSQREAERYQELRLLETGGEIRDLQVHPRFTLHAVRGRTSIVIGDYEADFQFAERDGQVWRSVVEDIKGMASLPLFRWKAKHLQAEYGITVREVR